MISVVVILVQILVLRFWQKKGEMKENKREKRGKEEEEWKEKNIVIKEKQCHIMPNHTKQNQIFTD